MDGYRQTLLGRALADALRELELETETGAEGGPQLDGDLLFAHFDEAARRELRAFTHEALDVAGRVTAFNRFLDDWSVQARVAPRDVRLNHCVADLQLPRRPGREEQPVAMRLKLRQRPTE